MLDVVKDIEVGVKMLKSPPFATAFPESYNFMYGKTNEALSDYYGHFPIEGRRVLTVTSSGDHILEAMKYKPSMVYAFDKNKFATYMAKLKVASVQALSYDEFITYFDKNPFKIDLYLKVRECLDEDARFFWDALYSDGQFKEEYEKMVLGMVGSNSYSLYNNHEDSFNAIKKNSNVEIKYIDCDFFKLESNLEAGVSFGSIFLSNIPDWLQYETNGIYLYSLYIEQVLSRYLDADGMIAAYAGVYETNQLVANYFRESIDITPTNKVLVYRKCSDDTQ